MLGYDYKIDYNAFMETSYRILLGLHVIIAGK